MDYSTFLGYGCSNVESAEYYLRWFTRAMDRIVDFSEATDLLREFFYYAFAMLFEAIMAGMSIEEFSAIAL